VCVCVCVCVSERSKEVSGRKQEGEIVVVSMSRGLPFNFSSASFLMI